MVSKLEQVLTKLEAESYVTPTSDVRGAALQEETARIMRVLQNDGPDVAVRLADERREAGNLPRGLYLSIRSVTALKPWPGRSLEARASEAREWAEAMHNEAEQAGGVDADRRKSFALKHLGQVELELGDLIEAHRIFTDAVQLYPWSAQHHLNLAFVQDQMGDAQGACDYFSAVLPLLPGDQREAAIEFVRDDPEFTFLYHVIENHI